MSKCKMCMKVHGRELVCKEMTVYLFVCWKAVKAVRAIAMKSFVCCNKPQHGDI